MKIVQIDKLTLIDNHIYYIKKYIGNAVFLNEQSRIVRVDIEFTIETGPLGDSKISLDKLELEENKTSELLKGIKGKILEMEQTGMLPDVVPQSI